MTDYKAPLEEISFVLETISSMKEWDKLPGFEDASEDMVAAILDEGGKFASEMIAPTNGPCDLFGAKLNDGVVTVSPELDPIHKAYVENGWNTLANNPEFGGQGLPETLSLAFAEMLTSANMAYSLHWILSNGAVSAIQAHGSDAIKEKYLPKMVSGEWSGSMNLTEPAAGSDVGALKTKAEPQEDGSYHIKGQKIFISWGEHELSENIIHLVLARTPGAPEGTRGISMFVVPKYLVKDDGTRGERNDVKCVGVEHKLGIHSSPTCVLSFGEKNSCVGYLVGRENKGMANMFTMMNHARIMVGLQGVSIGERAYQNAVNFAAERIQSAQIGSKDRSSVAIINHPDIRRTLMTMRAHIEAARAILYRNVWAIDQAHKSTDEEAKRLALGESDLLTPLSKAYATDIGCEVASMAVQVFGGMGYVEETGVAQFYRDIRIAPIYEGTNGIQALDLVGRKLNMDGGEHWKHMIAEIKAFVQSMDRSLSGQKEGLSEGIKALESASESLFANGFEGLVDTAAGATPYLRLFSTVVGAYLLAKQAVIAERRLAGDEGNPVFLKAKIVTAKFYIEQILPTAVCLLGPITAGADRLYEIEEEGFLRQG
ncbi:acyl-CoA dehydrogenase [Temperatibacter marinus]|uniref:3-methylmercaptopropionyl-CoA dehydrogenase n=1 Tax=Temperatibacter marinus TaxID=1456591 RepID=A0AA52EE01_9PROT|nr:acyl-CoA dehydrogenase [Temperatibacter marinus]WND01933.1 acyl-CoA dehydrogenase [Temperatibacter marinus]